jgi:undecaprenyl diphosphate synthase
MSCFSLVSSGSSFCAFNTPRRDGYHHKKKSILRSMMDQRRNSSFGGDFDYNDENNKEEDNNNKDKDPDEIAFLSSRDGERYNNMNNNKEENKNISSIKLAASTAPTRRDEEEEEDNDDVKEEEEEPEDTKEETETLGIRERFGRLLTNTFRKKWDSKPAMLKGLRVSDVPRHVAIIMDGNARWAEKRRLPPRVGHENGVESLRAVVRCASAWGIKVVSVYTFSIENWSRGPPEVDGLLELLETTLREDAENLMRNDVKVAVMGDLSRVKPSLRRAVEETVEMTKENQGVVLNVALSYGGRQDIVNAAKDMAEAVKFGSLRIEDISQETFMRYLGTANVLKEGEEDFFDDDRIDRKSGPLESDPLGDYAGVGERFVVNGGHHTSSSSSASSSSSSSSQQQQQQQQQEKGNTLSSLRAARSLQNPDLLIRTSGEQRLSNFMLFEMAYTELYFTDAMWPEFGEAELRRAIFAYAKRDRRFGSRAAKENSNSNNNNESSDSKRVQQGPPGRFGNGGLSNNTTSAPNTAGDATERDGSQHQPSSGSINALTLGGETNVLNSTKVNTKGDVPIEHKSSSSEDD